MEGDNFVLVLRRYETSLAQWRASLPADPGPRLQLYLSIFSDVLLAVQVIFFAASPAPALLQVLQWRIYSTCMCCGMCVLRHT